MDSGNDRLFCLFGEDIIQTYGQRSWNRLSCLSIADRALAVIQTEIPHGLTCQQAPVL